MFNIQYDELLDYARRISKTTMPSPGVTNDVFLNGDASAENTNPNGTPTPTPLQGSTVQTPIQSQVQSPVGISQLPSEFPTQQTIASTNTSLPEGLSLHLNPQAGAVFFPWPVEDKVRTGALASNQQLAEAGIDPKGYDPVLAAEEKLRQEAMKREAEEQERLRAEEAERNARAERERMRLEREKEQLEAFRRGSIATGLSPGDKSSTSGPGDKTQFQFTSMLDDDDD